MTINLTDREKSALASVDEHELSQLIDKAISCQQPSGLSQMLTDCGTYVANELRYFERAVGDYRGAKSAKKVERTHTDAIRAGYKLSSAVSQMKHRMQTEVEEGERFYVDDHIHWPYTFSDNLSVAVSYRWRQNPDSNWEHGHITLRHRHNPKPHFSIERSKRKLSARQKKENEQEEYARAWEHLKNLSLFAVRDFFRDGGNGNEIPETFQAIPDNYTGGLNNFSTIFWRDRSGT